MKSPSAADANTSVVIGTTSVRPKPLMKCGAGLEPVVWRRAAAIAIRTPTAPSAPSITSRAREPGCAGSGGRGPRNCVIAGPPRSGGIDQVAEDALEVVVERGDLVEAGADVAGVARDRRGGTRRRRSVSTTRPSRRRPARRPPPGPAMSRLASARGRSVRTRMRCGRSSIRSRMARKSPSAASRPWAITSTREPKRSTSSSTWLETITHWPSRPSRWNRSIMWSRWRGSRPVSGSSSTSTCGSWTSAWATLTRWRMPFE